MVQSDRAQEIIEEIKTMDIKTIRKIRLAVHNYEKKVNGDDAKKDKSIVRNEVSDEAYELAVKLKELVDLNFHMMREPDLNAWAIDIEKLYRLNRQPYQLIEAVIVWSQQDNFWKRNIRSGSALRKHFETLCMQAKLEYDQQKGKVFSV